MFNSTFKDAIHIRGDLLWQTSQNTQGRLLKLLIKERFALAMMGIHFPRNHKLFEIFDRKLQQMLAAGLINYHVAEELLWMKPKSYEKYRNKFENDDPKILSIKDLKAGFVIWLCSIVISMVAFIFEWTYGMLKFSYDLKRKLRKTKKVKPYPKILVVQKLAAKKLTKDIPLKKIKRNKKFENSR